MLKFIGKENNTSAVIVILFKGKFKPKKWKHLPYLILYGLEFH